MVETLSPTERREVAAALGSEGLCELQKLIEAQRARFRAFSPRESVAEVVERLRAEAFLDDATGGAFPVTPANAPSPKMIRRRLQRLSGVARDLAGMLRDGPMTSALAVRSGSADREPALLAHARALALAADFADMGCRFPEMAEVLANGQAGPESPATWRPDALADELLSLAQRADRALIALPEGRAGARDRAGERLARFRAGIEAILSRHGSKLTPRQRERMTVIAEGAIGG
jgi:hypothetical protein